jgi:hypothetical protein
MKALFGILLLAGIAFSLVAGTFPTRSFELNVTNPYIQNEYATRSFDMNVTNPYILNEYTTRNFSLNVTNPFIEAAFATRSFELNLSSLGVDFPVIYSLSLSPGHVNFIYQSLSISANLTTAYSQGISNVTANITGCGDGLVSMSKQFGVCSASCIYAGSFAPTQSGTCDVNVKATDLLNKTGYAQATATASNEQYTFNSTTGPDGIAGIDITALPANPSIIFISAGNGAKTAGIETSASSLYMNVLVRLGANPAQDREVNVEVI